MFEIHISPSLQIDLGNCFNQERRTLSLNYIEEKKMGEIMVFPRLNVYHGQRSISWFLINEHVISWSSVKNHQIPWSHHDNNMVILHMGLAGRPRINKGENG
jgi:hypothetical protein